MRDKELEQEMMIILPKIKEFIDKNKFIYKK
jgi:hypothetical protein